MKITKQQLKRIIKEEKAKLSEMGMAMDSNQYFRLTNDLRKNLFTALFDISDRLEDELGEDELAEEIVGLVEAFANRHNINL